MGVAARAGTAIDSPAAVSSATPTAGVADSKGLAAGTTIVAEIQDVIDSETSHPGSFIHALIESDVKGADGKIAISAGSSGVVTVQHIERTGSTLILSLSLYQVTVGEKSYLLINGGNQVTRLDFTEDLGKGIGHRNVHLQRRTLLRFKMNESVQFYK